MTRAPILELEEVRKYFGGVKAVDGVSFSIAKGEVHAIVGENGAGKSTLMNILAGVYPSDSGRILLEGKNYAPGNPRNARAEGINIVFQELALFPDLPVDANLFVGKEIQNGIKLDHQAMHDQARTILNQMKVHLNPSELVGELGIGQQQWVEIARAMISKSRVLILDEPNSALNQYETEELFNLIRHLKSQGMTILYISHRLEEVFRIADRITVMRDGQHIGTWVTSQTTISEIVAAMVGRRMSELTTRRSLASVPTILEVQDLSVNGRLSSISFKVGAGEVVGIAGLAGSGITELLEALFGIQKLSSGGILLDGQRLEASTPLEAMEHRIAMVPADRRSQGLMLNWSVADNSTLCVLQRLSRFGILNHRRLRELTKDYANRLRVITESLDKKVLFLSGGNQQKVLLARWLATQPRLLILDDPTRGIDVGAKHEIYELIDHIAAAGVGVLFTSSELDEILSLSDRILILRKGALIADLPGNLCDKELVMEFVAGDPVRGKQMVESRSQKIPGSVPLITAIETSPSLTGSLINDQNSSCRNLERSKKSRARASSSGKARDDSSGSRVSGFLRRIWSVREVGVLQALVFAGLLFTLLTPHFLTISNQSLILRQMSILAVITIGMTFVLASGEVDLSVGWIFNLAMSTMAFVSVHYGLDPWLTIPIGLVLGILMGTVNGLFAILLGLPTIIVTLGTMTIFRGMALALNQGRTIGNLPDSTFFLIGSGTLGPISYMTIIMLGVVVACAWIWKNSRFTRHVLAMGGNRAAAERVGVNIQRLRVLVMAFSGLMSSIAGILGLAFLRAADAQSGSGYELAAIAAAIIGGAKLGGGSGTVWGSLVGIALITVIQNGLVLLGLRPAWQIAFTGLVIIAAVTVDYLTRIRRAKASKEIWRAANPLAPNSFITTEHERR